MTGRLSLAALGGLPAEVRRPAYAPGDVGCGVVHLGIGAFHRAHQAVYLDDLIAAGAGNWRIIGVSLRSADVRDQLAPQDNLFTLVEREGVDERLRIIGSVASVLVAPENPAAVIAAIAAPDTHIISLTVTEKGYCHDPASGTLLTGHPDIVHDLAHPQTPRSAIGYLAAGLDQRRSNNGGPVTIVSCDNLPHNGAVLKAVLSEFARLRDPALAQWIDANVRFPATMVDRIVPATTPADRERLQSRLGVEDRAMVKAEPFTQWVIEDDFAGPRPPFEQAGAQMVADVRPFELAKLRMLNGAHSTIAYMGLAAGYVTVDQAIADPAIAAVIDRTDARRGGIDTAAGSGAGYGALCRCFAEALCQCGARTPAGADRDGRVAEAAATIAPHNWRCACSGRCSHSGGARGCRMDQASVRPICQRSNGRYAGRSDGWGSQ